MTVQHSPGVHKWQTVGSSAVAADPSHGLDWMGWRAWIDEYERYPYLAERTKTT